MPAVDQTPSPARRALVLCGHPRGAGSLSGALAAAYADGAAQAGWRVETIHLADLAFDPHVRRPSPRQQTPEPDLRRLQAAIAQADHLVFVYPTWWGGAPALLKGALDRALTPGWAFEETQSGTGYEGLLTGRSAELITTMDTPAFVYRWIYGAPGHRMLTRATLGFCGVDTARVTRFGVARTADAATRARWLAEARALGARLVGGPFTPVQRLWRAVRPWLQALRLQFYPMAFLAYALGALAATQGRALAAPAFWWGWAILLLLEAATVFVNDVEDAESDRRNRFWGPFTGGSRVIAQGLLTPRALRRGAGLALAGAGAIAAGLFATGAPPAAAPALAGLAAAALFYTLPPLKLSHRGLGEIDVAATHSIGVMLFGWTLQGGAILAPLPWLLAAPLALSVLPAIILSGVPDAEADAAAAKRTLVGLLGVGTAMRLAAALALAAAGAAALLRHGAGLDLLAGLDVIAPLHALALTGMIRAEAARGEAARRIDGLMVAALAYILWFVLVPLARLAL